MAGSTNALLSAAKVNKNDEFYTQMVDIEKEIFHYWEHFKGKTVFCNCDDPYESNFFKYFALNFNHLGLKKLIATCYDGSPVLGNELLLQFDIDAPQEPRKVAYKVEITEVNDANGDGAVDLADVRYLIQNNKNVLSPLKGNGDFRSPECVELLKEADIVVTNPPFSLFSEYIAQLIKHNKKFLVIGNQNALTYRDIFPLIQENKMWLGISMNGSNRWFQVPDDYKITPSTKIENGKKYCFVKSVVWFTNMEHKHRHESLILYKQYNPNEYPTYDNYDAINVDKVAEIPADYNGVMGVPITFLHKYCPEQFEIIWRGGDIEWAENQCNFYTPCSNEDAIKYRQMDKTWRIQNAYLLDNLGNPKVVYQRIFIRKKQ